MGDPVQMNVAPDVQHQLVLTRFEKRITEFGLTYEEVEQYIALLRHAQRVLKSSTN